MQRKTIVFLSICAALLAACATPEERCERRATAGYNDLVNEISETELNLARGYATTIEETTAKVWKLAKNTSGLYSYQYVDVIRKKTVRVPIDPATEQQNLAQMQGRLEAVAAHSDMLLSYCQVPQPS